MASRNATALAALGLGLATLVGVACGGGRRVRDRPTATVATSQGAAYELAEIEAAWHVPTADSRAALKARLERFIQRFPEDGATPLARVYLAFVDLDGGDLRGAEAELAALVTLDPGATNDFATVARAETRRARGRPEEALELLRPLAGKIVDRDARERFDEAIVRAALDAHRDYEAISYMDAWIRNTEEHERDGVRERVRGAIARMGADVLVPSLAAMRRTGGASGYGRDIQRIVTARVAELAVESDDAKLAQWLVDVDAGAVLEGETELLVSELATRQAGGTAFVGRSVGLVLPTASSSLRDAAGDVARGVAWALEIPRTRPGAGDDTRLVTRDDGGRRGQLESALEELAAEGAGVIIAGIDAESADRAVRWSDASGIPVLTLAAPARSKPRGSAFVLGESTATVVTALADALAARRETRVALVADRSGLADAATALAARTPKLELFQPAACELEDKQGGEARFPVDAWEKEKFRTWMVVGPEACARDVIHEVGDLGGALLALSLEGSRKPDRGVGAHVIAAAAGIVPVLTDDDDHAPRSRTLGRRAPAAPAGTTTSKRTGATTAHPPTGHDGDEARAPEVARYLAALGSVPNWRSALGRDAGVLARAALRELPLDTAKTADEVSRRRASVERALPQVKAALWSTDAPGLDAKTRTLPRVVRVVDIQ